jgi:RNA recognition motif-containing protein
VFLKTDATGRPQGWASVVFETAKDCNIALKLERGRKFALFMMINKIENQSFATEGSKL